MGCGWGRLDHIRGPGYLWPEPHGLSLFTTQSRKCTQSCSAWAGDLAAGRNIGNQVGTGLKVLETKFETLVKALGQLSMEGLT